jgi:two-component system, LuxR family, response regulator FixJ
MAKMPEAWPSSKEILVQSPATVFVVDDDAAIRDSLRLLLETERKDVLDFASGSDFLRMVEPTSSGCVILDYHMPKMNGLDLLERLRGRGISLPVILMTGLCDGTIRERAAQAGVLGVLEKPFARDALLGLVDTALGRT